MKQLWLEEGEAFMISFHLLASQTWQYELIEELEKTLPFTLSKEGLPVEVKQQGIGIHVTKKNDVRQITVGNKNELARAWYLMLRNDSLNEYEIKEQLSFQDLGVMLDCSRNAVMKLPTLFEYIRQLAVFGYQSLQLYTEDTIKVPEEPYFGYMRGAYTKEEIKQIDTYCSFFGMELVPCIQTLAHINQITRYERYEDIIDVNDIFLVGNEKTYQLIERIVATASECFTSRRINIGMDEAHMLGLGKYLDQHGYQNRFTIMVEHLKRVQEILHRYGFTAMMWSDMFFRLLANGEYYSLKEEQLNNDLLQHVPKDIELVYWDYYSRDYEHYEQNLATHFRISDRIGFAAGAWKWTGFAPENSYSQVAGLQAMKACVEKGVKTFLVTCWGDNGAEASAFSVLPTLFYYSELAYGFEQLINKDFTKEKEYNEYFKVATGISWTEYMLLDSPNEVFTETDYTHSNACKFLLYNDVLIGTFDSIVKSEIKKAYQEKKTKLAAVAETNTRYSYLFQTLSSLCFLLEEKSDLGVQIKHAYDKKDFIRLREIAEVKILEVIKRLDQFKRDFRYQWHKENKSFGFEIQLIRLGGLKERLYYAKEQILLWTEGGIEQIDELEVERLPFAYFEEDDGSKLNYNLWNVIVSPAVMG